MADMLSLNQVEVTKLTELQVHISCFAPNASCNILYLEQLGETGVLYHYHNASQFSKPGKELSHQPQT